MVCVTIRAFAKLYNHQNLHTLDNVIDLDVKNTVRKIMALYNQQFRSKKGLTI